MTSIDYFITDPYTSPNCCDQLFSEIPIYLPHSRFCYAPPAYVPQVSPLPSIGNGFITFGSFNRLPKLVDPVIESWAAILNEVPDGRLLIKAAGLHEDDTCRCLRDRFEALGLDPKRLVLQPFTTHDEMFGEYGGVDIALDPFPFNGGMTTLEALWMGVPVVTVTGASVISRQTTSVLSNIGVAAELAFPDVDSYIRGAVALAKNRSRLMELRQELRHRMESSPICQPWQFMRDLESLYRRMWIAWCSGSKLESDLTTGNKQSFNAYDARAKS